MVLRFEISRNRGTDAATSAILTIKTIDDVTRDFNFQVLDCVEPGFQYSKYVEPVG